MSLGGQVIAVGGVYVMGKCDRIVKKCFPLLAYLEANITFCDYFYSGSQSCAFRKVRFSIQVKGTKND